MIYGFKMATCGEDAVWVVIITLSTRPTSQTVPMCCDQQTEFKTEFEKKKMLVAWHVGGQS